MSSHPGLPPDHAGDEPLHDLDRERLRALGHAAVDRAIELMYGIDDGPVHVRPTPEVEAFFDAPLSDEGTAAETLLEEFDRFIAPYPMGNGHPRFSGWVNSPPDPMGVLARLLGSAFNPSVAGGDQSAILCEKQVVRWFRELFGFPEESMGLFTSGGSMATLLALGAARQRAAEEDPRTRGLRQDTAPLYVYASAEVHTCIQKAVELLGIGADQLRTVAADASGAMLPEALARALDEDRDRGRPMAVCASVGTASTGVLDPVDAIAEICTERGIWLHLDGAYGGVCTWLEEYRELREAVRRADSLAVDPHKWLGVPVDAGLVLVRHPDALRQAFELVPAYIRDDESIPVDERPFWFSHHGFEQTRPFRALPVWMTLKHRGRNAIRARIQRDLTLARRFADRLRAAPDFELWEPQGLSIVCFRLHKEGLGASELERKNRDVLLALQRGGRFYPTGTVIDGSFWLRSCFLHPRTTHADTAGLLDEVRRLAES